eukprot:TRINITY_DN9507_c0_g1_i1.p1 TRINITY_DN9507_c0_g1~~TRINITY_DN9507_c0_g1_i1.p1  ORF type:complete len:364 (+),score=77.00 TRINITY_DN9507_c0_g1_i1:88-1092(+)
MIKIFLFLGLALVVLVSSVQADFCNAARPTNVEASHVNIDGKRRINISWDDNGASEGACWQVEVKPVGSSGTWPWRRIGGCSSSTTRSIKKGSVDDAFPEGYPDWDEADFKIRVRSRIWDTENCGKKIKSAWRMATSRYKNYEATYKVIFESVWSEETHPEDFPDPNQHFSGLVGATHNRKVVFWSPGELASDGIESMAETGSKSALIDEVNDAIDDGKAQHVLSGGSLGDSPDKTNYVFDIASTHPRVTLVSMIAPSPDWFVGVHGLSLWKDGDWVQKKEVTLYAYDAGTDSGKSFTSSNDNTQPAEDIKKITSGPLGNGEPMGTFTFKRTDN